MDYPIHIHTISKELYVTFEGVTGRYFYIVMSLKIVLNLAKSADPGEMPHYAAFHFGLNCLPKYLFTRMKSPHMRAMLT